MAPNGQIVPALRSHAAVPARMGPILFSILLSIAGPATSWAEGTKRAYVSHGDASVVIWSPDAYEHVLQTKLYVVGAGLVAVDEEPSIAYTWTYRVIRFLRESVYGRSASPRASEPAEREIPVSNDGDAFATACDARTMVVVGANSATPVSLVDLTLGREVATAPYANRLGRAVAVDDAATYALVVLDDPVNNTSNEIRRVAIGQGTLTDTGEQLAFGSDFVRKVRVAPGGKFGLALVGVGATRLVSFSIPGLAIRSSVTLAGGTGNALVLGAAGDRVYARSGRRAIVPDIIEGFTFDPTSGALGSAPVLRIDNIAGFTGVAFLDPMALAPEGDALLVVEDTPEPRIARYRLSDGAFVEARKATEPQRGVSSPRVCQSTQTAVEFHHAAFDHYFVTTLAKEITLLDDGTLAGWTRTGASFPVYASGTAGTAATCRFFSTAFGLRSSHFYTPVASECTTVKSNPVWQFEGEVFNVTLPAPDGTCTPPEVPLYRLYNDGQGGAPNHRYTTSLDLRAQMQARGWIPEGDGIGVIGCVPGATGALAR